MSVTESFLSRLSQKIKAFYLDQQGVYGVMTALLLLPLIMLVAFTVETTGILLDKTGKVQFVKEGKLTDDEVKEVISRVTALIAK